MKHTLAQIAELTGSVIVSGDPAMMITGFSTVDEAEKGDITFLGNPRYLPKLKRSRASAVLALPDFKEGSLQMAVLAVVNPTLAFQAVVQRFGPQKFTCAPGIHPTAVVADSAKFDRTKVFIGPHAVVEENVELGDGCEIHAGAFIGREAKLGAQCIIHANASIKHRCVLGNRVTVHSGSAIGADGFGYEFKDGRHMKVDQVGIVQIDDDVEIGSCTTIDRARFGRTWVGEGTKIDNLVQIAHNCVLGKHCIICAQVGIAGSTQLGDFVTMAGQSGAIGHLTIGSQTTFLAKTGVTKDCPEPGAYIGFPAKPVIEGRRLLAAPAKIPNIIERLKALEAKLGISCGAESSDG